ncbi:MAG TPA: chemotaxis protein, partial [Rhodocyclaceae bacterium]|nr:chemotaxis protein [Rhodocyclaceae bacterium]
MITAQAGGQSARESALRTIVRINEQIKAVIGDAFRVRMMSLNALILAKRAGQSAVGFGVLSNELRGFASEL